MDRDVSEDRCPDQRLYPQSGGGAHTHPASGAFVRPAPFLWHDPAQPAATDRPAGGGAAGGHGGRVVGGVRRGGVDAAHAAARKHRPGRCARTLQPGYPGIAPGNLGADAPAADFSRARHAPIRAGPGVGGNGAGAVRHRRPDLRAPDGAFSIRCPQQHGVSALVWRSRPALSRRDGDGHGLFRGSGAQRLRGGEPAAAS